MAGHVLTVALNAAVDTTYLVRGFTVGGIHTAVRVIRTAGGKANNVARVLHTLGVPVVATGLAGGAAGALIQQQLGALGIAADFEPIAAESRTCLALLDDNSRVVTEVREPGPTLTPAVLAAFRPRFRRLLTGSAAVVFSGSLPPGLPTDTYAQLIAEARGAGALTVLDTGGQALAAALPAGPDLVKPNREELAAWAGRPLPDLPAVGAAARALRATGARAVAVSLGAGGLLYDGPDGTWQAVPPAVNAVNTVGSGDSLVAGYLAGRGRNLETAGCLRLGVACGTASALTGDIAVPRPDDIERLLPQVRVNPVLF